MPDRGGCRSGVLCGLAAQGVARSEDDRGAQRERKEDAYDGGRAQRKLAVRRFIAGDATVLSRVLVLIILVVDVAVHWGWSLVAAGAMVGAATVLLKRLMSSRGRGKTMVVFFSTPISVRVCR